MTKEEFLNSEPFRFPDDEKELIFYPSVPGIFDCTGNREPVAFADVVELTDTDVLWHEKYCFRSVPLHILIVVERGAGYANH